MAKLLAACVQMRTSVDIQENIEVCSHLVRAAAREGAQLVVTPEMTTLLDRRPGKLFEQAQSQDDDVAIPAFSALAHELDIDLVIGSIPIQVAPDKCAGRSFLFGKSGTILATYDKIHMFDVQLGEGEVYRESDRFRAGMESCVVEMEGYNLGLTICYDLRFPELYRSLAKHGADIITVPSSFTTVTGEAHWHVLLRARAIESGCFILAPAQHGHHADGRDTYGHTLIVDPWGRVIAERAEEPGVLLAELDLSLVANSRQRIPSLHHDRTYSLKRVVRK